MLDANVEYTDEGIIITHAGHYIKLSDWNVEMKLMLHGDLGVQTAARNTAIVTTHSDNNALRDLYEVIRAAMYAAEGNEIVKGAGA